MHGLSTVEANVRGAAERTREGSEWRSARDALARLQWHRIQWRRVAEGPTRFQMTRAHPGHSKKYKQFKVLRDSAL